MPLGERVMVLEGLRMRAEPSRYARVVGAGAAGGKGIAASATALAGYSSVDCATCVDVGEYRALAAERRRLAQRAVTMRASAMRRAMQGDEEARARVIDAAIAEKAALALAENADAAADVASELKRTPAPLAHTLVAKLKELAQRASEILKSDRDDWIPRAGGYSLLMGRFGARKKTLAGLGAPVWDPNLNRWVDDSTSSNTTWATVDSKAGMVQVRTGGDITSTQWVQQAPTCPAGQDARLHDGAWKCVTTVAGGEYTIAGHTLSATDQATYDRAVQTGVGPFSPAGGSPYTYQIAAGKLPFNATATQVFYYNRDSRTLRVTSNDPTAIQQALDAVAEAAEGVYEFGKSLAKTAACLAAEEAAKRAMSAAGCGAPPFASTKCKLAAAAQAKLMRAAGCTPPAEYAAAEAPAEEGGLFSGAAKIAIPALLAVALLGGGK